MAADSTSMGGFSHEINFGGMSTQTNSSGMRSIIRSNVGSRRGMTLGFRGLYIDAMPIIYGSHMGHGRIRKMRVVRVTVVRDGEVEVRQTNNIYVGVENAF
ncbi:hypothetical protein QJS10_CPA01g00736 [Acorus calamus]|uniref:Uncharacterized protein n=1 Tax=Acorus calamus TaxID=4465 RepID=A0AAV9FIM8_ACOCL|nr:hypothetical protein QJS10_CPA01g00736 [Acorus calamus]